MRDAIFTPRQAQGYLAKVMKSYVLDAGVGVIEQVGDCSGRQHERGRYVVEGSCDVDLTFRRAFPSFRSTARP